ncbi:MAG: alpha/beta hydrolase, partial [Burkholderiaceae bacterium]|nr:alpha/beta hydrolase [Burkholderiaceae bacterium]
MLPSVASPSALHHAASVDRPTVVCLHSSGSSASQWKRLMEAQQGAYRFIAVDFFGHGRVPGYAGAHYTLQREADAVWNALASV